MSVFGDLGSFVIANMGIQRSHQHEGVFQVVIDLISIELNAVNAKLNKPMAVIMN